jgi:nucleoporin NUP82
MFDQLTSTRTILVGQFYHGLETSPQVAQVRWHPWGENASTLLVLTVDGILREYDVGDDAEEPAQLVDFCQEEAISRRTSSTGGGPSRLGLSAEDVDGDIAVSFCFGAGSGDWGPLTIYCLMRNGDLYAVSPFVPVNA